LLNIPRPLTCASRLLALFGGVVSAAAGDGGCCVRRRHICRRKRGSTHKYNSSKRHIIYMRNAAHTSHSNTACTPRDGYDAPWYQICQQRSSAHTHTHTQTKRRHYNRSGARPPALCPFLIRHGLDGYGRAWGRVLLRFPLGSEQPNQPSWCAQPARSAKKKRKCPCVWLALQRWGDPPLIGPTRSPAASWHCIHLCLTNEHNSRIC
jgi:hypothetical protein